MTAEIRGALTRRELEDLMDVVTKVYNEYAIGADKKKELEQRRSDTEKHLRSQLLTSSVLSDKVVSIDRCIELLKRCADDREADMFRTILTFAKERVISDMAKLDTAILANRKKLSEIDTKFELNRMMSKASDRMVEQLRGK